MYIVYTSVYMVLVLHHRKHIHCIHVCIYGFGPAPSQTHPGVITVTSDPGVTTVTCDPGVITVTSDPGVTTVTSDPGVINVTSDPGVIGVRCVGTYRLSSHARLEAFVIHTKLY